MRTLITIAILLLATAAPLASQAPAAHPDAPSAKPPATTVLPPVPAPDANRFLALVVQQQAVTSTPEYKAIMDRLSAINAEWMKAESDTLAAMKLDPKSHAIQVTQDGKVSVVKKEPAAREAGK